MRRTPIVAVLASLPLCAQPDFRATLWPVLEKAQCRQCHNDNGVASTTKLQFPPEDAAPGEIHYFGRTLRRLVDASQPEQSLLLRKPTNRLSHAGGERIAPGSADEQALRNWVSYLATLPADAGLMRQSASGPSRPVLRRLTHSQYNHTVRDLLGDETRPADQFPKEDFVHGFTNQAEGQSISPLLAEAYARSAERLAKNAFRNPSRLVRCTGSDACRGQFISDFGRRAFRRPLEAHEIAAYRKLFARETGFHQGAQLVVEAMLQSPHFLFHLEPGPWAVASRLSYFLWDTMPDEPLMAAAASGELDKPEGIERQARRMLADGRARASFDEFVAQWLRFDRLRGALRDRNRFPEYSAELAGAMIEETTRLFRSLVWDKRNFMEFYNASYTFVVPELARLYGLPAPQQPWEKVTLPKETGRAGILGQATFLTLTSKPADTSPTDRGLFVREHFLCQQVPPPPPGVNATLPVVTDEKPATTRERLSVHLSNQVCASCHSLVDPVGFGFERFDAIGKYRTEEFVLIAPTADEIKTRRKTKPTEYRLPIDARGYLRGLQKAEFSSPRELGEVLANEPGCQRCVVKQLFRWAVGRAEQTEDQPVIEKAFQRFRESGFQFQELIIALATSDTYLGSQP